MRLTGRALLCFLYALDLVSSGSGKILELVSASGTCGVHSGSRDHLYTRWIEKDRRVER